MRSVAVTNAKGGVGKSTTAINLAAAVADLGKRVLLIDADPSGNATLGYFPTGVPSLGLADMLLDGLAVEDVALPSGVDDLLVVPPGTRLGVCSDQMGGSQGLGQGASSACGGSCGGSTGSTSSSSTPAPCKHRSTWRSSTPSTRS